MTTIVKCIVKTDIRRYMFDRTIPDQIKAYWLNMYQIEISEQF